MHTHLIRMASFLIGAAVLSFHAPLHAQEEAVLLEEIVVTARKREENLMEVPISITALDNEFISQTGSLGIFDLAEYAPNLTFRQSYGRTFDRPGIRGQAPILGGQTVGLFIDGVFVAGSISNLPLSNLERVEVIKGPQAALFGRQTLAGAINYVTRAPSDEFEAELKATAAEHGQYETNVNLSGTLIEGLLQASVGLRYYEYGGEYTNMGPGGGELGAEQTQAAMATLYFTPTDNFSAKLRVMASDDDDGLITQQATITSRELNCYTETRRGYYCGKVPVPDFDEVNIDNLHIPDPGVRQNTLRSNLEMSLDIGGYELTSITAWSKQDEDWQQDAGSAANRFFLWTLPDDSPACRFASCATTYLGEDLTYRSQELRLSSPLDRPLRWMLGGYLFNMHDWSYTGKPAQRSITFDRVDNRAFFGSLEMDFNSQWTGTAELRWSEDDVTDVASNGTSLQDEFAAVTPRMTLVYRQSDNGTLYGSVSKGTKPGGFNASVVTAPEADKARLAPYLTYDESEAWNYEVGAKYSLMGGRANITGALFFIQWDKQHLQNSTVLSNGRSTTLTTNIGETEITGVELSVNAQLSDNLSLVLNYGLADAEIVEGCDFAHGELVGADPQACDQSEYPGSASIVGKQTPNTPKHTGAITTTYRAAAGARWQWFVSGDLTYESTRYAQVHNFAETGDTTKVNLRLGLDGERWSAWLWGRNLFENRSANSVIRLIDLDTFFVRRAFTAHLPRGRQLGVSMDYRFGA